MKNSSIVAFMRTITGCSGGSNASSNGMKTLFQIARAIISRSHLKSAGWLKPTINSLFPWSSAVLSVKYFYMRYGLISSNLSFACPSSCLAPFPVKAFLIAVSMLTSFPFTYSISFSVTILSISRALNLVLYVRIFALSYLMCFFSPILTFELIA